VKEQNGLVMIYTGDGKGKTTAAMGLVLRAVGHGYRVCIMQFMKGQDSGEIDAIESYLPKVDVWRSGRDVFVDPDQPDEIDIKLAQEAFERAAGFVKSDDYDLIVLDEINVAVSFGLIAEEAVLAMLATRSPSVTVVMTGRGATVQMQAVADLVSEVREVKHHWRKGIKAQKGIEF